MKARIHVVEFNTLPAPEGYEWTLVGVALCTVDGKKLQPMAVFREEDRSLTVAGLDQLNIPGGMVFDISRVKGWVRFDQLPVDVRLALPEIVLAQLRGKGRIK